MTATITYNPSSQKKAGYYDNILTKEILEDICLCVTGQKKYRIVKDVNHGYNKGRLVIVKYNGIKNYVTLSETEIKSRNSCVQSIPTAINIFMSDKTKEKKLFYYFMQHKGNAFTDYLIFIYKLFITAGYQFLNLTSYHSQLSSFSCLEDLIHDRDENRKANPSNNSSFVTKNAGKVQIYAKVFGANKYESTLLALAVAKLAKAPVELFNICEGGLKMLPEASRKTLKYFNITTHNTALTLEKSKFLKLSKTTPLRSPIYIYNLLQRLGHQRCVLCDCEISELIHGAHIWNIHDIKGDDLYDTESKFQHAINGNNGLWLCQNHHKLLDENLISINEYGDVMMKNSMEEKNTQYIMEITTQSKLPLEIMTTEFQWYLSHRNLSIDLSLYKRIID